MYKALPPCCILSISSFVDFTLSTHRLDSVRYLTNRSESTVSLTSR